MFWRYIFSPFKLKPKSSTEPHISGFTTYFIFAGTRAHFWNMEPVSLVGSVKEKNRGRVIGKGPREEVRSQLRPAGWTGFSRPSAGGRTGLLGGRNSHTWWRGLGGRKASSRVCKRLCDIIQAGPLKLPKFIPTELGRLEVWDESGSRAGVRCGFPLSWLANGPLCRALTWPFLWVYVLMASPYKEAPLYRGPLYKDHISRYWRLEGHWRLGLQPVISRGSVIQFST